MSIQNSCAQPGTVKAIIGLGNPGKKFVYNRHNIGFMVVDYLATQAQVDWHEQDLILYASMVIIDDKTLLLVKPHKFMNNSGIVVPWLANKNIKLQECLVIHDELEFPFGKVACKCGGSARGHNGLRSIIAQGEPDFCRIRCGIGRPENKEDVAAYVLSDFTQDPADVQAMIQAAAELALKTIQNSLNSFKPRSNNDC